MSIPYVRNGPPREKPNSRYSQWYANKKWMKLSKAFLQMYPFCVLCLVEGKVNQGVIDYHSDRQRNLVVDHIVPHGGDIDKFWDQANWQTLCRMPCHDAHKRSSDMAGRNWLYALAELIQRNGTRDHVQAHAEWLPEHIREALGV